jgi:hypothetical protein
VKGRTVPLLALAAAAASHGCTEEALTNLSSDLAPGESPPTVELVIPAAELPAWRDTTYVGFEIPSTASIRLLSDRADLQARILGRFSTLPDSVFVDTVRVAVEMFDGARVRVVLDTSRSVLPPEGLEASLLPLTRSFLEDEATWQLASDGDPWDTPGGDFGQPLGSALISELTDTIFIDLDVNVDSVLTAWRDGNGEPGFGLVAEGPEGELRVRSIGLIAEARPEGLDTLVTVTRGAVPNTLVFDPPTPPTGTSLRLVGLPAARIYFDFELPERVQGLDLRGSTINRAAIEFRPLAAPQSPFTLDVPLAAAAFRLRADPFELHERTPIGETLGPFLVLDPDSLAAGGGLQLLITDFVQVWAAAEPDSSPDLRIGVRPFPEGQELGLWDFGSVEDAVALQPLLRLLITPRAAFRLP